jgi:hypothetical protein
MGALIIHKMAALIIHKMGALTLLHFALIMEWT